MTSIGNGSSRWSGSTSRQSGSSSRKSGTSTKSGNESLWQKIAKTLTSMAHTDSNPEDFDNALSCATFDDPDLLRGSCVWQLMHGGAGVFINSEGDAKTYELSCIQQSL